MLRRHASTSSLPTTRSGRHYTMDKQKALGKKQISCGKEHINAEWKSNNLVINFSTSAYELAKMSILQILNKCDLPYKHNIIEGIDNQCANVDTCIKVFNKLKDGTQGKTQKFVINLYHTSSGMVVNGSRIDLFIDDIYKKLCTILSKQYDDLTIINEGLFKTLETASSSSMSMSKHDICQKTRGKPCNRCKQEHIYEGLKGGPVP